MENKFIRNTLLLTFITSLSYLVFVFFRNYHSPEKIEERCRVQFQKEAKRGDGKSDKEWGLNIDIANENYFKCMKIP